MIPAIDGYPTGVHNSGSNGCGCHGGSSSSITPTHNFPAEYDSSVATYSINIGFSGGGVGSFGGYSLQVSDGVLSNPDSNSQISGLSITHNSNSATSWTFDWSPPASGSGAITVNLAVLNANGAGSGGDVWNTVSVSIPEFVDTDGDGYSDQNDAFPNDPNEWEDTDGDGVGDNSDWAPNDSTESADSDGDGVGDNADAFPNDASETTDSDGDGVGDNADQFPNDSSETIDTDGDLYLIKK